VNYNLEKVDSNLHFSTTTIQMHEILPKKGQILKSSHLQRIGEI